MNKHPHKDSGITDRNDSEAFYDEQDERASADLIEDLMATEYATPPPGILVPEKVWKKQKRHELAEQFSTKPFRNRFSHGLNLIVSQLRDHVSQPDLIKISGELAKGAEHFLKMMNATPPKDSENTESFQELLHISDETIEQMYQCGVRLDHANAYQDAADVFFVLSILDHKRHNIWMALGLNEQRLGHIEPALKAYAMAMITDMEDPWSYLHSAECYQSLGETTDAKECLEACLTHTSHLPADQARQCKDLAQKCRAQM